MLRGITYLHHKILHSCCATNTSTSRKLKTYLQGLFALIKDWGNIIAHLEKFVKAGCWETSVVYSTIIYMMF